MLYERYSNPTIFLEQMLKNGRFAECILEILKIKSERDLWEFYLHKVDEISFEEFMQMQLPQPKTDLGATVKHSFNMLKTFKPSQEEEC